MTKEQMTEICNQNGHEVIKFVRVDKQGVKRIYVLSIDGIRYTTSSASQSMARAALQRITDQILIGGDNE